MQQKREVRFSFWRIAVVGISGIAFFVRRVPRLGIGWIGDDRVHIERVIGMYRVIFIEVRPVFFQRVAVPGHDVIRQYPTHDKVHPGKVVGVFLQLLDVIHDAVAAAHIPSGAFVDIDEQGARTAGGVVDFDLCPAFQVMGNNFRHQKRNLMGRIEFARLFPCVGGKIADKILVDESEDIIVLLPVHGNILDEVDQVADRFRSCAGGLAQFGKPGLEGGKNIVEYLFVGRIDEAAERGKRIRHILSGKVDALGNPTREKIFIGNKVPQVFLDTLNGFAVLLAEFREVFVRPVVFFQIFDLFIRKEFIKMKPRI